MKIKYNKSVVKTTYEEVESEVAAVYNLETWITGTQVCHECLRNINEYNTEFGIHDRDVITVIVRLQDNKKLFYHIHCWKELNNDHKN